VPSTGLSPDEQRANVLLKWNPESAMISETPAYTLCVSLRVGSLSSDPLKAHRILI